jgi:hypothetical protein
VSDEIDPEVLADLRLRAATERDPTRSREMPKWTPPRFIGKVPCRGRCGALIDWPEDAEEQFAMFNRELARRMEAPLDKTRIDFCAACRKIGVTNTANNNRKGVDAVAVLIREYRGGTTSPVPPGPAPTEKRQREILDQLKKLHHPDVEGLEKAVREARDGKTGKKRATGAL